MKDRLAPILGLLCATLGGYLHGFVYYPRRWPLLTNPEVIDLGAVLMGAFLGWMVFLIFYMLYEYGS